MSTNIEKVSGALAEFSRVEAGIAALTKAYAGVVYDVTTTEGMGAAREARRIIREPRYEVEKVRKDAKAPLLALGKEIDAEAKRITAALLAIEEPIDQQIAAEEARKEAEHALANQTGDFDYGRASAQLAEAAAQLATLRKMKNRAGRG